LHDLVANHSIPTAGKAAPLCLLVARRQQCTRLWGQIKE